MTTLPQTAPMRMPRPAVPSQLALPGPMHAPPSQMGASAGLTGADVWRVIRANLWLIVIAAMASGVLGYLVNNYLAKHYSRYTSSALMVVKTAGQMPMPGVAPSGPDPSQIEIAKGRQAKMIEHEGLFNETIQDPSSLIRGTAWFKSFKGLDEARANLSRNLSALPVGNSDLIEIRMTCPTAEDTKVIVQELGDAHIAKTLENQRKIEQEKVKLLSREADLVRIELDEEVIKPLREKELLLGQDNVGTSMNWSGKQLQLERLLQESTRIASELAGLQSRRETLEKDLEEGRIPAEVQQRISQDPRAQRARETVDELELQVANLIDRMGPRHEQVIQLQKILQARVDKLAEITEEAKSEYAETFKTLYRNEITASVANAQRIQEQLSRVGMELGQLNKTMTDYRVLQTREVDLRKKVQTIGDEMTRIRQFVLAAPWAQAEWGRPPQKPDRPSFPRLLYTMLTAVTLGLALSLGIAFLRELTDTTVRSPRDIARVGQLNLLGMIPHEHDDPQSAGARLPLAIFEAPTSIIAEQFRQIRTKLQHGASLDTTRSILVTSPSPGDGKTMVAVNLAASLALNGRRILLVDANFRKPTLHAVFAATNEVGFSDVLQAPENFAAAVRETEVTGLSVLTSGPKPANPSELMESQLLIDFIEQALEEYDHVIFDSGPLLVVSDTIALAPRVDGVMTVVRARGNSRGLLMRMRDELRKVKAEHLGVVLNAVRSQGGGYYGRNIKTYYAYQNG